MSIFKRGSVYRYHFLFNGEHIQKSTKQGNPRTARQVMQAQGLFVARVVRYGALVTTRGAFRICQHRSDGLPNHSPIQNPSERRRMAAQTLPGYG